MAVIDSMLIFVLCAMAHGVEGQSQLSKSDEFTVSQGNYIGDVDITDDMYIELEVKVNEWSGDYGNVLLVGDGQGNAYYGVSGTFPFQLWFMKSSYSQSYDFHIMLQYHGGEVEALQLEGINELNRWYHLEIDISGDRVKGSLDGQQQFDKDFYMNDGVKYWDLETYPNVPCYASTPNSNNDPYARPASVSIRNLLFMDRGACSPLLTGFYWNGFNGVWTQVGGEEDVYSKDAYGATWYMWLETVFSSPAWVIGRDYNANNAQYMWSWNRWGWKWGDDLFDGNSWWYKDNSYNWNAHSANPEVSCSSSTDASSSLFITGAVWDGAFPNDTDTDTMDSIPPFPDRASSGAVSPFADSGDFLAMMFGAAIGATVLVTVIIAVFLKRRNGAIKSDAVIHVPEVSDVVTTEMTTEKVSADGVEQEDGAGVVVTVN